MSNSPKGLLPTTGEQLTTKLYEKLMNVSAYENYVQELKKNTIRLLSNDQSLKNLSLSSNNKMKPQLTEKTGQTTNSSSIEAHVFAWKLNVIVYYTQLD